MLKASGWRRLFAAHERPEAVALAAANGGASITALALPGRFDDAVRVVIVRSFRGPAGVRTICLSLFMLGLVDSVALAPFALAAAVLPGQSLGVRLGLALVAVVGLAAGGLIVALPRMARSKMLGSITRVRFPPPPLNCDLQGFPDRAGNDSLALENEAHRLGQLVDVPVGVNVAGRRDPYSSQ